MKIQDILAQAILFLKPISLSARLDAEIIIADTLNCNRENLYVRSSEEIEGGLLSSCLQKIERRIQGEPVAYITNKKDFFNQTFYVDKGVLIPRPETELLVEYALHWIEEKKFEKNIWALDIGCGSGCIGISLLKEVFKISAVAIDRSTEAIEITKKNAKNIGVEDKITVLQKNADEISFKDFDFLKAKGFLGSFDLIISNPPYIARDDDQVQEGVKKYEPHEALYCEEQGLEKIKRWTSKASELLCEDGLWIFEIGNKQGRVAKEIVRETQCFKNIKISQDYSGCDRFIIATKKQIKAN